MATSIYMKMLLTERVKLEPSFLHKQFRDEVVRRLKIKVEGICSRHGFVRPNSIEIHKICTGKVELIGLNGNTEFDVMFYADVCNPMLGSIIKCKVSNINKFGILAEAENVIEAIIAKNSVNIQSDIDLDKVRIGDDILIEVVGKKYELNEKKIALIGRALRDTNARKVSVDDIKPKKLGLDDIEGDEEGDDIDDDADVRSLVGGAKSNIDSDDEANSDAEEDDVDDAEEAEEDDIEDDADDDADAYSENGSDDDKNNGNFYSDEEEYYQSDGGSFVDDEEGDDTLLSDDE